MADDTDHQLTLTSTVVDIKKALAYVWGLDHNMKPIAFLLLMLMICSYSCKHNNVTPIKQPNKICFQTDVLPLYQSHCALSGCHDATTARLGVELDSYANIMKGIAANKPDSSHYYTIVALGAMPPPGSNKPQMSSGQIDTIKMWINEGATNSCGSSN